MPRYEGDTLKTEEKKKMENFETLLTPLLTLPVSKIRIHFKAQKEWQIHGRENHFRGKIGYNLRRACCPFPNYRRKNCDTCELSLNCLYLTLFSPTRFDPVKQTDKKTKKSTTPARPFVLSLDAHENTRTLSPGQTGEAVLTLFGPAVTYCSLFIEAAVSGLSSFPLSVTGVTIESPQKTNQTQNLPEESPMPGIAYPLSDWIFPLKNRNELTLDFITPVRLTKNEQPVREEVNFLIIIQAVLRRLRDIKRAFSQDSDMGKTEKNFFEAAKSVEITENNLNWTRHRRYSRRQKQNISLNGFTGRIGFNGPIGPFYPLIKAGQIIHIGKSTSAGNGRIEVVK